MIQELKTIIYHFKTGTLGHIDHGKTTLTAAITSILQEIVQETFRLMSTKEEIC